MTEGKLTVGLKRGQIIVHSGSASKQNSTLIVDHHAIIERRWTHISVFIQRRLIGAATVRVRVDAGEPRTASLQFPRCGSGDDVVRALKFGVNLDGELGPM